MAFFRLGHLVQKSLPIIEIIVDRLKQKLAVVHETNMLTFIHNLLKLS